MTLTKSLLLGSAATLVAVAGAQAADLPSKKAAPATYVKVCDAYGAGFFNIPGTDTCLKVGGYVRAEYQYTPAVKTYSTAGALITTTTGTSLPKALQDTTGHEVRGRWTLDARTPSAMGPVRTFVSARVTSTSGIRAATVAQAGGIGAGAAAANAVAMEAGLVQFAGFTFGKGPENYAMMPGIMYGGAAWAGFPNGMNQLAYTHNFGGGISATVAIEDRRDTFIQTGSTTTSTLARGHSLVGNVRLDQSWGFAAVHAMTQPNSYGVSSAGLLSGGQTDYAAETGLGMLSAGTISATARTKQGWAVGSTVSFKLPMIAPGDQVWLTANYTEGALNAVMGGSAISSVNTASQFRLLGGLTRVNGNIAAISATEVASVKAWNVGGLFTHYWAAQWRSNFAASYVKIDSPTTTLTTAQWGDGALQNYMGSLIFSPVANADIGLEVQYATLTNKVQNGNAALTNSTGLRSSNWSTKLRVERSF